MTKELDYCILNIVSFEQTDTCSINMKRASGSGVEYNLAKVGVAGSNPVSRFEAKTGNPVKSRVSGFFVPF